MPSSLLLATLTLSAGLLLIRKTRRVGYGGLVSVVLVLIALAVLPIGPWLLAPLEHRFGPPVPMGVLSPPPRAILVLGGAADARLARETGDDALGPAADRLTAMVRLSRLYPETPVLFSGGSGRLGDQADREADHVASMLDQLDLPAAHITWNREARNTAESGAAAAHWLMMGGLSDGQGPILLITSAFHMPRAVGVMRSAGIDVTPYPVDVRFSREDRWRLRFDLSAGLIAFDHAARAWLGLLAYRLAGHTDQLLPGPARPATRDPLS